MTSPDRLISLRGRTAYVTVAAGGVGSATAEIFATAGARATATDGENVGVPASGSGGLGSPVSFRPFDLATVEGPEACSLDIASTAPDMPFINAAVFDMSSVLHADLKQHDRIFELNVRAPCRPMQAAARTLSAAERRGSIINLSSQAGRRGEAPVAHDCASKSAVISCTQSAALSPAPPGIRVNAIALGIVDTQMLDRVASLVSRFGNLEPGQGRRLVGDLLPLGRMGRPDRIARAALFLTSDLSACATGQTINVDGGNVLS